MTSLFVVLLAVVAFALCSMREPTPDARICYLKRPIGGA
jgi:hypothetical protein